MGARRPSPAPETVTIPRVELATQAALLALADRALGLVMDAGPHGEMALLDLERSFILARTAIRNEIARRPGGSAAPSPACNRPIPDPPPRPPRTWGSAG
ncbi:hypothetical protein AA12717_1375 [Gluconacetobacter sacchari DSM 12717]|uniref:Uncharacterized protein n=2 Tax=Gluconacetobacter sacchari TaxID=92759 RepID=A0A7W4IB96_9PROT|nr:hypothetical protein [Gluconacetobacter sacchari]MBB2159696.1 hypothetical protein [Gluconacetobacter sacchari]GBQ23053.1 hypothetical protein AA12717_1375 [Gluconacetobacter sacchari DSM 12717]